MSLSMLEYLRPRLILESTLVSRRVLRGLRVLRRDLRTFGI